MLILRIIALTGLLCTVNSGILDLGGGGGGLTSGLLGGGSKNSENDDLIGSVVKQGSSITSLTQSVAKDDSPADGEITKAAMDTVVKISDKAMIVKSKLTDAKSKAKKKDAKKKPKKTTTAATTTEEPDDEKEDEKDD